MFHITHESSFGLLVEGTAIAAYQVLRQASEEIVVRIPFSSENLENVYGYVKNSKVLYTLFGLNLISSCDQVLDTSGRPLKDLVVDFMHTALRPMDLLVKGEKTWVASRWPGPRIPGCLALGGKQSVPDPQTIASLLYRLRFRQKEAFEGTWTHHQRPAISYVYEAFRNLIEHATLTQKGYSGILIERVGIDEAGDVDQYTKQISRLGDYLKSFASSEAGYQSAELTAITVADYGIGIQRSLPPIAGETETETFRRAFRPGVSSKPKSGAPNYGQGLAEIMRASRKLQAFLVVRSRGLLFSYDGRAASDNTSDELLESRSWSDRAGDSIPGVTISLIFPNRVKPTGQISLEL